MKLLVLLALVTLAIAQGKDKTIIRSHEYANMFLKLFM